MTTTDLWSGQTVVIRGGHIAEITPREKALVPRGATRIDGTGKYVIPGLVDSHIHLQQDENTNRDLLTLFLLNGVTTVLNLYGTPLHLALRAAVDRGEVPGPRILTSGPSVGAPHGQTPTISPEEIAREVAAQKRLGYDFIKLHGDLSLEAYRRLMAASRQENLLVVGHAPRNLGVGPMLSEQQQAVAHLEEYLYAYFYYGTHQQEAISDLDKKIRILATATKKAGTSVISTIEVYRGIADQIADWIKY
jgi:dihydroorotase-like cyclic amidohydrolase